MVGFAVSAFTRDLVWLGTDTDNNWDLVTDNWFVKGDDTKTRVCFEPGDNVYFLESDWVNPSTQLVRTNTTAWAKEFDIGSIVISNDTTTFTWKCNVGSYVDALCFQATSIDKYGNGALATPFCFQWNCDYTVHGGRFISSNGSSYPVDHRNDTGSMIVPRTVSFLTGSTWDVTGGVGFGGAGNGAPLHVVFSNATFKISQSSRYVSLPRTTFYDTSFIISSSAEASRALLFTGDIVITGSTPAVIPAGRTMTFGRKDRMPLDVRVDDVTGDDATDFTVGGILCNMDVIYPSVSDKPYYFGYGNFRKTGAGTMSITHPDNTFTGNVEIAEGTLRLDNTSSPNIRDGYNYRCSTLGAVDGYDRTITVKNGATLFTGNNVPFGLVNTPMSFKIAVEEGGALTLGQTQNNFGQLSLEGGNFSYTNGAQATWIEYGLMAIGKKLSFSGSTPYDLQVRGTHNVIYLGFTLDSQLDTEPVSPSQPHLTNLWSVVEIEVADITGDSGIDAAIGLPMRDMINMCYPTYGNNPNGYTYDPWKYCYFRDGIRKTGTGTLRLNGVNAYTHTTEVAAGTLLVDGTIATSSGVTVDAGAFLGGTGTVSAVTLTDGAGFICTAKRGQTDVLKMPSLTMQGAVTVRVLNPDATEFSTFNQNLLKVTGLPASVDFTNWSVSFEGVEQSKMFTFAYDSTTGIVSAHYAGGTMILLQ